MSDITFDHINHFGEPIYDNELFIQIHNPNMLLMYDCNYLQFKKNPTLEEFQLAEQYLLAFHLQHEQYHLKFLFPENERIRPEVFAYLKQVNYYPSRLELYFIEPRDFPSIKVNPQITIERVNEGNLENFLKFQFELDSQYGLKYAEQRQAQYRRNFFDDKFQQIVATLEGVIVGSVDLIISEKTVEMDALIVQEAYRNRGIGSMLQKYVMNQFSDRTVILVACGEDTPREMYRKQNYQNIAFQYEALKILSIKNFD